MAERTKIWIADRMKELMKHKSIDRIRVTDICRAAEIERSTFYYHFQDKYDLVAWILYQSARDTDILSVSSAAAAMNQMKKNFTFFKRAYEDSSQTPMWSYMLEYFVDRYVRLAKEKLNVDTPDTRTLFSIRLYCYGTLGMTREWLLYDNITPAETVVELMYEAMPEKLQSLFFG